MANYTQKAIINEFETMLKEMPFNKITVSALATRCEISSNTFYYHFKDIYDLLDTWLDLKKESFMRQFTVDSEWETMFKQFLGNLKNNESIVYNISGSITRERLERYVFISIKSLFFDYIRAHRDAKWADEEMLKGITDFCCYIFLGITLEFIWGHMEADIDSTVDRMGILFNGSMEYIVQKMKPEEGK